MTLHRSQELTNQSAMRQSHTNRGDNNSASSDTDHGAGEREKNPQQQQQQQDIKRHGPHQRQSHYQHYRDHWNRLLPQQAFNQPRHLPTRLSKTDVIPWKMKNRLKTVHVALVLCLNIGVDPPDRCAPHPCAKLQCWTDPFSMPLTKALEAIGSNLKSQYERWQPRVRRHCFLLTRTL